MYPASAPILSGLPSTVVVGAVHLITSDSNAAVTVIDTALGALGRVGSSVTIGKDQADKPVLTAYPRPFGNANVAVVILFFSPAQSFLPAALSRLVRPLLLHRLPQVHLYSLRQRSCAYLLQLGRCVYRRELLCFSIF